MEHGFEIKCDGSMPVVYVGGEKLKLVSLVYKWHTKTDKASDGCNICVVDGFFEGSPNMQRFVFDIPNMEKGKLQ